MAKRRQTVEEEIANMMLAFDALVKAGCLEPTGEFDENGDPKHRVTEVGKLISAALKDPTFLDNYKEDK
jgi:hypothetical protein